MVDTCVAPSELHLKKELSALQKARFLRDPATCSSWRSPLSCKSFTNSNQLNYGNKTSGLSVEKGEKIRKKVYLYNWKHHSAQSSDSGIKLDEDDKNISIEESPEAIVNNPHKANSTNDTYSITGMNLEQKLRSVISKKQMSNSDDIECSNSDDSLQLTHVLTNKVDAHAYRSPSVSPLFSGSGCGNWSYSSKFLRSTKKDGSSRSYTPASTSTCYNKYIESCDGMTTSIDGDELDQIDLPRNQGCGIPCYWRKKTYSPSLSDTLRRKGSSLLRGSNTSFNKKKYLSKSSQGLPLLSTNTNGGNSSLDTLSDELSINCGELELESLSRLDGRRWSNCTSQEVKDIDTIEHKSLSQKYTPRSFNEIIGQNIVVNSLNNAILRGRIAPAYLFQGPRGTGKTSTARLFAAALNCLSTEDNKPCGVCRECNSIFNGHGSNVREVDAINKKGIDRVRYLLKNMSLAKVVSRYKVFIIDECHMLSPRMWAAFMNFLQEPPPHLVLIFITIDPDSLPRAIMSRSQKYIFSKVKDVDIVSRLRKISYEENLDIELDALDLIALNSDGSLRDAETMLEQLSLLGKKITTPLVNELLGVVSDERLLDLLEIAMSSDTAETVRRSRELMDSGVDPMALMSQLAGLIMDIIAGTNQLANLQCSGVGIGGKSLSEDELKRLQQALKILSDTEKQLRLSSERSTWFTAALLQLGSGHNTEFSQSSNSSKHSIELNNGAIIKDSSFSIRGSSSALVSRETSGYCSPESCSSSYKIPRSKKVAPNKLRSNSINEICSKYAITCLSPEKLSLIWRRCIQRCHSETLRQLLSSHGKLVSITETENTLIASIVFEDINIKSRAERSLSSITNSFERLLHQNVEVRIGISGQVSPLSKHTEKNAISDPSFPRKSLDCYESRPQRTIEKGDSSLTHDARFTNSIDEHRLESAWLQVSNKNSKELATQSNPNRNQVLPQNGVICENHKMASVALAMSSKHWENKLKHESIALKISGNQGSQNGISPSLLHSNGLTTNFDKENQGYESGPGCSGLFCWQPRNSFRVKKHQVKKGVNVQSPKTRRVHCLGIVRGRKQAK